MAKSLSGINTRTLTSTPQTEKAHVKQTKNKAGGYTFSVSDVERVKRFLIIGTDGGTYYTNEQKLSVENAKAVLKLAQTNHPALVSAILDVSLRGAAPKQDATLFALAIAASTGSEDERRAALSILSQVARTGTHLFQFAGFVEQFRGWGRGLRKAVASWYTDKDVDQLAYQMVKYRQRNGWSHRDLLRLAHPSTQEASRSALFDWAVRGNVGEATPRLIEGFLKAQEAGANIPALIKDYGLSWEMLPDSVINEKSTWDALLDKGVPMGALIRQLGRLARIGVTPAMGGRTTEVANLLTNPEALKKARIHPINLLTAMRTYASGASTRGSSAWKPSTKIVDALDKAFYLAFDTVEPAGKRTLLALDVSGSMGWESAGTGLTAREISVAMAMVTMASEPESHIMGFTSGQTYGSIRGWGRSAGFTALDISPRDSLQTNINKVSNLAFGGTDCSLPFTYAEKEGLDVDTVVVYTDNETYAGYRHPFQALEHYRKSSGLDTKLVAVGVTATESTITNPDDAGSLSVVGFDPAVPRLISDFSKGF